MPWCENNHRILNANKTVEMIVDFRRTIKLNTISILGEAIMVVEDYRYLGVYLDSKLDWKCNTEAVFNLKKCILGATIWS